MCSWRTTGEWTSRRKAVDTPLRRGYHNTLPMLSYAVNTGWGWLPRDHPVPASTPKPRGTARTGPSLYRAGASRPKPYCEVDPKGVMWQRNEGGTPRVLVGWKAICGHTTHRCSPSWVLMGLRPLQVALPPGPLDRPVYMGSPIYCRDCSGHAPTATPE